MGNGLWHMSCRRWSSPQPSRAVDTQVTTAFTRGDCRRQAVEYLRLAQQGGTKTTIRRHLLPDERHRGCCRLAEGHPTCVPVPIRLAALREEQRSTWRCSASRHRGGDENHLPP